MMKQEADLDSEKQIYLTCEKYYIFELLIFAAGMMGAYTFNLRGGVFCNAQTANVVLMALAFGKGEIANGVYYLIPISAYIGGGSYIRNSATQGKKDPFPKMGYIFSGI